MNTNFLKENDRKLRQAINSQPPMTYEEFIRQASTTATHTSTPDSKPVKKEA
jgi:hypothetical protein